MLTPSSEPEHFSKTVAPVIAGFSLPTIAQIATGPHAGQPQHEIALASFVIGTALMLCTFQLAIGSLLTWEPQELWGSVRAGLAFAGLIAIVIGLVVEVGADIDWSPFFLPAAVALVIGTGAPMVMRVKGVSSRFSHSEAREP